MAEHNEFGQKGEETAARYLTGIGYQILERNWRFEKQEIDIIAKDGEYLVIVEVKTRSSSFFGDPAEAVKWKKRKGLVRAADAYVNLKNIPSEVRYDIISIIREGDREKIRHITDAFYPTL
ncbi:MAG: YraN family protein [Bacteroidales bacterium]